MMAGNNRVHPRADTVLPLHQSQFSNPEHVSINGGQFNNVGGNFVTIFNTAVSNRHRTLWETVAGVRASHNSDLQILRGECLPGTREAVLEDIHRWRLARNPRFPVCWLSGPVGVGKSAIALTVARACENDGLVASFFFFRFDDKRNNPSALILTIAHGLVVTRPSIGRKINQRITNDPRILDASLEDQFQQLVIDPLRVKRRQCDISEAWNYLFSSSSDTPPDLVLIDGVDECSDSETQKRILSIISSAYQQTSHIPLRFLICSRPESWIQDAFKSSQLRTLTKRVVLDKSFFPNLDIRRYLLHGFREIVEDPMFRDVQFPNPWPEDHVVENLVDMASGQFIYAATVLKFLKTDQHPIKRLNIILEYTSALHRPDSPFQQLDLLYHIILSLVKSEREWLLEILAAILLLDPSAPTSPRFIEALFGLEAGEVSLMLRPMHSVLDIRTRDDNIRIYHTSFLDFCFDRDRAGDFFIDKSSRHQSLSTMLFDLLINHRLGNYPNSRDMSIQEALWRGCVDFCFSCKNPSEEVISRLDKFYSTIIQTCSGPPDTIRHVLSAVVLLPPHACPSFSFIDFVWDSSVLTEQGTEDRATLSALPRPPHHTMFAPPPYGVRRAVRELHPVVEDRAIDSEDDTIPAYHPSFTAYLNRSRNDIVGGLQREILMTKWLHGIFEWVRGASIAVGAVDHRDSQEHRALTNLNLHRWYRFSSAGLPQDVVVDALRKFYTDISALFPTVNNPLKDVCIASISLLSPQFIPTSGPMCLLFPEVMLGPKADKLCRIFSIQHDDLVGGPTCPTFFDFIKDIDLVYPRVDADRLLCEWLPVLVELCGWLPVLVKLCGVSQWRNRRIFRCPSPERSMWEMWTDMCCSVQKPTPRLVQTLKDLPLGLLIVASSMITDDTIGMRNLAKGRVRAHLGSSEALFLRFEQVANWTRSKDLSQQGRSLLKRLENVQKFIHLPAVAPSHARNRNIARAHERLPDIADCKYDVLPKESVVVRLRPGLSECSCDTITSAPATKIPSSHIDMKACYIQLLKAHVEALSESLELLIEIVLNILDSTLLVRCGPEPDILPLCRTFFDSPLQAVHLEDYVSEYHRQTLFTWLDSYPASFENEVQSIRRQLTSLLRLT